MLWTCQVWNVCETPKQRCWVGRWALGICLVCKFGRHYQRRHHSHKRIKPPWKPNWMQKSWDYHLEQLTSELAQRVSAGVWLGFLGQEATCSSEQSLGCWGIHWLLEDDTCSGMKAIQRTKPWGDSLDPAVPDTTSSTFPVTVQLAHAFAYPHL